MNRHHRSATTRSTLISHPPTLRTHISWIVSHTYGRARYLLGGGDYSPRQPKTRPRIAGERDRVITNEAPKYKTLPCKLLVERRAKLLAARAHTHTHTQSLYTPTIGPIFIRDCCSGLIFSFEFNLPRRRGFALCWLLLLLHTCDSRGSFYICSRSSAHACT